MRRAELSLLAILALAGCSMAPPLEIPSLAMPGQYKHVEGWQVANPGDHLPRGDWWAAFHDPVLDGLVVRVEDGSPTLAAGLARYDRALAAVGVNRSEAFPTIDVTSRVSRERLSAGRPIGPGMPVTADQYVLGSALSYEIDLWGRVRNTIRAGEATAEAEAANLSSIRLSLQAAVVDAYFQLRGLDAESALLGRTVSAYDRAHRLIVTRHDGGIASGTDVNRARAQLSTARARAVALVPQRVALENRIAVLIGAVPSTFDLEPSKASTTLPAVSTGIPSELLQRRPDIASAQRRLIAANARIGVAKAALFPAIGLGISGGYQATGRPLISAPTSFWALGPLSSLLSLFDGGRRKAEIAVTRSEYDELAARYRETVLTAFQEVEDALSLASTLAEQEREQRDAARAAVNTERLALDLYRDGASDYLDVVTAQTAALSAEQAAISVGVNRRRAAVALIRAIGGSADAPVS